MQDYFVVEQGAVAQWECDHMGHWNVQFYIARLSDGIRHLRHIIGDDDVAVPWDILEILVRYQREMHAGDVFRVEAGILSVQENTVFVMGE